MMQGVSQHANVINSTPSSKMIPLRPTVVNNELSLIVVYTQPAITCSKLTIETVQQGVKYVQY